MAEYFELTLCDRHRRPLDDAAAQVTFVTAGGRDLRIMSRSSARREAFVVRQQPPPNDARSPRQAEIPAGTTRIEIKLSSRDFWPVILAFDYQSGGSSSLRLAGTGDVTLINAGVNLASDPAPPSAGDRKALVQLRAIRVRNARSAVEGALAELRNASTRPPGNTALRQRVLSGSASLSASQLYDRCFAAPYQFRESPIALVPLVQDPMLIPSAPYLSMDPPDPNAPLSGDVYILERPIRTPTRRDRNATGSHLVAVWAPSLLDRSATSSQPIDYVVQLASNIYRDEGTSRFYDNPPFNEGYLNKIFNYLVTDKQMIHVQSRAGTRAVYVFIVPRYGLADQLSGVAYARNLWGLLSDIHRWLLSQWGATSSARAIGNIGIMAWSAGSLQSGRLVDSHGSLANSDLAGRLKEIYDFDGTDGDSLRSVARWFNRDRAGRVFRSYHHYASTLDSYTQQQGGSFPTTGTGVTYVHTILQDPLLPSEVMASETQVSSPAIAGFTLLEGGNPGTVDDADRQYFLPRPAQRTRTSFAETFSNGGWPHGAIPQYFAYHALNKSIFK